MNEILKSSVNEVLNTNPNPVLDDPNSPGALNYSPSANLNQCLSTSNLISYECVTNPDVTINEMQPSSSSNTFVMNMFYNLQDLLYDKSGKGTVKIHTSVLDPSEFNRDSDVRYSSKTSINKTSANKTSSNKTNKRVIPIQFPIS